MTDSADSDGESVSVSDLRVAAKIAREAYGAIVNGYDRIADRLDALADTLDGPLVVLHPGQHAIKDGHPSTPAEHYLRPPNVNWTVVASGPEVAG